MTKYIGKLLFIISIAFFLFTACGSSESALDAARNEGYQSGYDDGYSDGFYDGHDDRDSSTYNDSYYNGYEAGKSDSYDSAYYDGYYDGYDDCYRDFCTIIYDDAENYSCESGCHPEDALAIIDSYEGRTTYWEGPLPTEEEYHDAIESLYYFYEYFYGEYFLNE